MAPSRLALGLTAAIGLAVATPPSVAFALQAVRNVSLPSQLTPGSDLEASQRLAAAIGAEIGDQVTNPSSPEDLEAQIVFVLSQGSYRQDVIATALNLLGLRAPENVVTAIGNVRMALFRNTKLITGTAALNYGNYLSGTAGAGGFSTPGISTGGGSAGYAF